MTTRYQSEHYEDVARILYVYGVDKRIVDTFADLFAADNPPACIEGQCPSHGGFNRERFLTACGLESEG